MSKDAPNKLAFLMCEWTPANKLPPAGKPVLAHVVGLRNDGHGVVLRASYWPEHTLEYGGDDGLGDTDPDTGEEWAPAGWYEEGEIDCAACLEFVYAPIAGNGGKVTHWMVLPAKPELES